MFVAFLYSLSIFCVFRQCIDLHEDKMTTYKYQDSPHTALLKKLNAMRKDRVLYDVSLIVGDQTVPAHKNILVACSDYFRSLFVGPLGNNSQTEVDLTPITTDSNAVETVYK